MNLFSVLQGHARFSPEKTAIAEPSGNVSYSALLQRSQVFANHFRRMGVGEGDRVAILALNHADWFSLLFACARCGVILVPLNWRLSAQELNYILQDSSPRIIYHDKHFESLASQMRIVEIDRDGNGNKESLKESSTVLLSAIGLDASEDASKLANYPNWMRTESDIGTRAEKTPFLIVYTSGTTGTPKGAVLSQQAIWCSALMSQHMLDLSASDIVLNVLPLFHVGGLNIQPLPALLNGATLIQLPRFEPVAAIDALAKNHVTLMNSVPTLLQAMLDEESWLTAQLKLRLVSIGSTDVPLALFEQLSVRDIPLIQVYGATETGPVAIYQRLEHAQYSGSIGRCGLHCDIRLVDEQGVEVENGQSGEIQVRGKNILNEYWNNPAATDNALCDGWFGTGDVAHQDRIGFYWFDARIKHVIISGGENIYPAEIERTLRDLPGINEMAVVGKPDERWGEVPVVVLAGEIEPAKVFEACAAIAKFKQPKAVYSVDTLPRNALGKVLVEDVKVLITDIKPVLNA